MDIDKLLNNKAHGERTVVLSGEVDSTHHFVRTSKKFQPLFFFLRKSH